MDAIRDDLEIAVDAPTIAMASFPSGAGLRLHVLTNIRRIEGSIDLVRTTFSSLPIATSSPRVTFDDFNASRQVIMPSTYHYCDV